MTPTPKLASGAVARAEAGEPAAPAADAGPFVLNLCSSTTPMALAQTDLPELKRFTFFVSRRFEEGRERFRLHMGYFTSLAEAEEWLGVVREIYPGAWAGEAPGKKLRERAAAAAAQAGHAVGPQSRAAPPAPAASATPASVPAANAAPRAAPAVKSTPPRVPAAAAVTAPSAPIHSQPAPIQAAQTQAAPAAAAPMQVPTVHAAAPAAAHFAVPTITQAAVQSAVHGAVSTAGHVPSPPVVSPPVVKPAPVQIAARAAAPAPGAPVPTVRAPAAGQRRPAAPKPAAPATQAPQQPAGGARGASPPPAAKSAAAGRSNPAARSGSKPPAKPVFADSNVREVLAALDETAETGQTRMMPAPPAPLRLEEPQDSSLTDTQVLRFLETRRAEGGERPNDDTDTAISLLKPDDTGTRRALKEAVAQNAPVSFAVQLQWSVQTIELDKVPPLAIFSAYTLYTVEGSRDGRKWYGLRLGFFSDAISAKQVAYYVRSEFASVAVVPVSPQEKARATEKDGAAGALGLPKRARQEKVEEFKLIDHDDAVKGAEPAAPPQPPTKPAPVTAAPRTASAPAASGKRARGRGKVGARERRGPQTLEETLEILGASELEIDNGRGETLNDSGVRHLRVEVQKNTPFSRLLERLSERAKKS